MRVVMKLGTYLQWASLARRNVGVEATAPEGDEHERMASSSFMTAPSIAGHEPHVVESSSLGVASFDVG